jgi:hypothetical protein
MGSSINDAKVLKEGVKDFVTTVLGDLSYKGRLGGVQNSVMSFLDDHVIDLYVVFMRHIYQLLWSLFSAPINNNRPRNIFAQFF